MPLTGSVLRDASGLAVCCDLAMFTASPNWASSLGVVGTHAVKTTARTAGRRLCISFIHIFFFILVISLISSESHRHRQVWGRARLRAEPLHQALLSPVFLWVNLPSFLPAGTLSDWAG